MKFYNEKDLENGNFEKAWQEIEEISKRADEEAKMLSESPSPQFNTIEEARAFYGSIPFAEWENMMRERLGI